MSIGDHALLPAYGGDAHLVDPDRRPAGTRARRPWGVRSRGYGAALVSGGSLSAGTLIAFLLCLDLFFSPVQSLSQVLDTWQQAAVAVDRITELLGTPVRTPAPAHPRRPGRLRGEIAFDEVSFTYAETTVEVLHGLALAVSAGQTMALVGETGAGKSTIAKLIARFYDVTGGRVTVDGVDVRDYDLTAYRRQLGIVPQEPCLFAGTVRDNIAYGRPGATDTEVEAAARAVGAHGLVRELPGGYRHIIGSSGLTLSSGQRQRLALARAELVDPTIVLLDEATSNLDPATEAAVGRAMTLASSGRTTVVIAHRLATAARADSIALIDHGQLVEHGPHHELLQRGVGTRRCGPPPPRKSCSCAAMGPVGCILRDCSGDGPAMSDRVRAVSSSRSPVQSCGPERHSAREQILNTTAPLF